MFLPVFLITQDLSTSKVAPGCAVNLTWIFTPPCRPVASDRVPETLPEYVVSEPVLQVFFVALAGVNERDTPGTGFSAVPVLKVA
jgi:hypothetical protein